MTFTGIGVGLVAFASAFTGQATGAAQSTIPVALTVEKSAIAAARFVDYSRREAVTEYVKEYFADMPILAEIAFCESTYRQVGLDGEVLRGNIDSDDVGVMQINTRYHSDKAEELGLDLHTLEGNLEYAKYLYEREGVRPWKSSFKCWMKSEAFKNPAEA
jgi:hypothetical protein